MTAELVDLLKQNGGDPDTVQQTVRLAMGVLTDDLPPEIMKTKLEGAVANPKLLDEQLQLLTSSPEALDETCLAVLSDLWESDADTVRTALAEAKADLPVVELALLAVIALYGMWLHKTGGVHISRNVVKRLPNGTIEEETAVEFYDASAPLKAITSALKNG
jgi:hypothetical protein